ncbi:UDP-glucose/GDP-mannose dehydrogenase family protein [Candidatus Aerophobetes bacterium]|nr:UDP-glucose/GDP-mannose dehydrogenase family protein [Candidatus Aerophobetes bacterium]
MKNICMVGTGYVGLVTGAGFAELGNRVVCVDVDEGKIEKLKKGKIPFFEEGLEKLIRKNIEKEKLSFTTSLKEGVANSEVIFIAVGTPSKETGEADLSYVIRVAEDLSFLISDYKIIAVKSTVPVGTLELVTEILGKRGKVKGKDFDIASTPEFLREGNAVYDFFHPSRVIIGCDNSRVGKTLEEIFTPLKAPIVHTSPAAAQMIKYASNTFLACRISFINEIANICEKVGADVVEVAKGMGYDKRIGEGYLNAGIGFGGPCLIKDLKALIKIAEDKGYEAGFLKAILEKNEHQIRTIVYKVKNFLGEPLYEKKIGVLGLTFKQGTSDVRNSLSLKVLELLQKEGARIKAYDPQGMEEARNALNEVEFAKDPYEVADGSDILLILTGWEEFKKLDFKRIKRNLKNPFIVDGVNLLSPERMRKAGFNYKGVGRS